MKPPARGDVVGYVWTDYKRVPDGAGGHWMEPQRRLEVRFEDLLPDVQRALLYPTPKEPTPHG